MKLTEIDIDRFRIWHNLLLRLDPKGLNVIYGPNEAGKTTLMRFIRSTLYGYEPLATEPAFHRPDAEQPWRGAVRCEHGGRTWRIHRRAELAGRGRLRISGGQEGVEKDAALDNILSGTTEDVYADIFAVGVILLFSQVGQHPSGDIGSSGNGAEVVDLGQVLHVVECLE